MTQRTSLSCLALAFTLHTVACAADVAEDIEVAGLGAAIEEVVVTGSRGGRDLYPRDFNFKDQGGGIPVGVGGGGRSAKTAELAKRCYAAYQDCSELAELAYEACIEQNIDTPQNCDGPNVVNANNCDTIYKGCMQQQP